MLGIRNKIICFVISNKKLNISSLISFFILFPDHITHTKCCRQGLNTLLIVIDVVAPLTTGVHVPRMLSGQF